MVRFSILAWWTSIWESEKKKIQEEGLVRILKWVITIFLLVVLSYFVYSLVKICSCYGWDLHKCLSNKASETNPEGLSALKSLGSVLIVLGGFLGLLWIITRTKVLDSAKKKIQEGGWVLILKWVGVILLSVALGYLIYALVEICWCYGWDVPKCFSNASETNPGGFSTLKSLGSVLIVLGGFLGLLWSITRTKVLDKGNRDNRFAHATKMLGSQEASVRLGAVRILFDMALKPEGEHLRATIANMMCAHIQTTTDDDDYKKKHEKTPSHEIENMLDLLFVPKPKRGEEEKQTKFWDGIQPKLKSSYLRGVDLGGANLKEADLQYVQLQESVLTGTMFYGAQLDRAKLHGVRAEDAVFNGATLIETEFWAADLRGSQFRGAFLQGAQFQLSDLRKADFRGSILCDTQIYALNNKKNSHPRCKFSGSSPNDLYWLSALTKLTELEGFEERIKAHEDKEAVLDEEGKPEGVLIRSSEGKPTTDMIIRACEKHSYIPEEARKQMTEEWESTLNDSRKDMERWGDRIWFKSKKYGPDKTSEWIEAYKVGKKPKLRDWSKKNREYLERLRKDREATKPKE